MSKPNELLNIIFAYKQFLLALVNLNSQPINCSKKYLIIKNIVKQVIKDLKTSILNLFSRKTENKIDKLTRKIIK